MLTLEIVGPQAAKLGVPTRKEFGLNGGTIGRSADNDWMIPDSYISGKHAQIHVRNGRFFIVDCSVNGTSLKSRANRLTKGQWYPLVDQDSLFLDSIEVRIHVQSAGQKKSTVSAEELFNKTVVETPFGVARSSNDMTNDDSARLGAAHSRTTPLAMPTDAVLEALFNDDDIARVRSDLLNAETLIECGPVITRPPSGAAATDDHLGAPTSAMGLGNDEADASEGWPRTQVLNRDDSIPAPASVPVSIAIDTSSRDISLDAIDDSAKDASLTSAPRTSSQVLQRLSELSWMNPEKPVAIKPESKKPEVIKREVTKPEVEPPVIDTLRLNALLEGVGIPPSAITPELSDIFGDILRATIGGLIDLLRERDAMKDSFRLNVTKFKPAENNPLRFSANVEDALYNLLIKRNAAYLPPAEAISNSFADARSHQAAMLVAMRSAFASMMQFFDPDKLAATMDDKPKRRFFGKGGDEQWSYYTELYRQLAAQADHGFEELFGEHFAKAYQQEIDRLRDQVSDTH